MKGTHPTSSFCLTFFHSLYLCSSTVRPPYTREERREKDSHGKTEEGEKVHRELSKEAKRKGIREKKEKERKGEERRENDNGRGCGEEGWEEWDGRRGKGIKEREEGEQQTMDKGETRRREKEAKGEARRDKGKARMGIRREETKASLTLCLDHFRLFLFFSSKISRHSSNSPQESQQHYTSMTKRCTEFTITTEGKQVFTNREKETGSYGNLCPQSFGLAH